MASQHVDPTNQYDYVGKSVQELRKEIVNLVRQNQELFEDKKEYVSSITEITKENDRRIANALEALKTSEAEGRTGELDRQATNLVSVPVVSG